MSWMLLAADSIHEGLPAPITDNINTPTMTEQFNPEVFARRIKLVRVREAGCGELCSACSKTIETGAIEYEVKVQTDDRSSVLRFHSRCYAIWSGETVD
jgi:hypothetical protein